MDEFHELARLWDHKRKHERLGRTTLLEQNGDEKERRTRTRYLVCCFFFCIFSNYVRYDRRYLLLIPILFLLLLYILVVLSLVNEVLLVSS